MQKEIRLFNIQLLLLHTSVYEIFFSVLSIHKNCFLTIKKLRLSISVLHKQASLTVRADRGLINTPYRLLQMNIDVLSLSFIYIPFLHIREIRGL